MTYPPEGPATTPRFLALEASRWADFALLDTGGGRKLERFGSIKLDRPEPQAVWSPALGDKDWASAHAVFEAKAEESGGQWKLAAGLQEPWMLHYRLGAGKGQEAGGSDLKFIVRTTQGRHVGVFPEGASNWDWIFSKVQSRVTVSGRPNILNLFGYTGLASLAAAAGGGAVTHVDASRKSVAWARANQEHSALIDRPIRWIVDDALKFAAREVRRGMRYDGIILDPPKFGRGPKGEIWDLYADLPALLDNCRMLLSAEPVFVILTIYAVRSSAIHVAQTIEHLVRGREGDVECGELVVREQSAGRLLSQAVFARWSTGSDK